VTSGRLVDGASGAPGAHRHITTCPRMARSIRPRKLLARPPWSATIQGKCTPRGPQGGQKHCCVNHYISKSNEISYFNEWGICHIIKTKGPYLRYQRTKEPTALARRYLESCEWTAVVAPMCRSLCDPTGRQRSVHRMAIPFTGSVVSPDIQGRVGRSPPPHFLGRAHFLEGRKCVCVGRG
jgi:hypothetical protein